MCNRTTIQAARSLAIGSLCGLTLGLGPVDQVMAQSNAWTQVKNNNDIIEMQKSGGDPSVEGEVTIDFFGHAAFRLTSPKGFTALFDPYRNDPSGAWGLWFPSDFPNVEVDAVLSTHAHFDHDAIERPRAQMILDRMSGGFEFADMRISGLADKHTCEAPGWYKWTNAMPEFGQPQCPPDNYHHLDNNIYVIETGGMRIAIWGDNRDNPAEHVWAALTEIDVLILPVDSSQHILSYEQSDRIVDRVAPHIVIPEHYLTSGVSITLTTLGTAEEWVKLHTDNHTMLPTGTLKLNPAEVRKLDRHVMYFGGEHLSE
jgi:L-ascorbate metabolism protein UlaG (beta-lactamase superfamily)